jgi:hypothetical protein
VGDLGVAHGDVGDVGSGADIHVDAAANVAGSGVGVGVGVDRPVSNATWGFDDSK